MSLENIIPQDWDLVNLSDLTSLITKGTTPTTNGFSYLDDGVNFVKVESIHSNGSFIPSMFAHVGNDCHDSFKRSQLSEGDILYTIAGALGRSAIVQKEILPANTNQAVAIIRLKNADNRNYIYHYLRGNYVKRLIDKINVSTAQANLSLGQINKFKIPIPPLPEQKKIAEILSTVDAKIGVIDQQITETQELKKGLMQRLLTKGIGHTEFKDSPLGEIPKSWEVKRFEDDTEVITCGVAATPIYVDESVGIPFLSAQNVRGGKVVLNKYKFISKEHHAELTKKNKPTVGDILYSRVGAKFGEAGVVEHDFEFSVYVSLTFIRVKPSSDSYFIKYLLNSSYVKNLALRSVFQGAGVPNLNVKVVREFKLAIPPLIEQKQIANILKAVDEKLDVLIDKNKNYKELKKGLMQQLLTGKVRVQLNTAVSA